jgi:pimeloyl-ACP methyl ester carboxylesterase
MIPAGRRGQLKVATESWGDGGELVLMLHGLGSCSTSLGRWGEELSGAGFRAVAVDVPGHGRSGPGRSLPQDFFAALEAAVAYYGEPYGLAGHSMGCLPAAAMALDGRCSRLVLAAPLLSAGHALDILARANGTGPRTRERMTTAAERMLRCSPGSSGIIGRAAEHEAGRPPLLVLHDSRDPVIPFGHSAGLVAAWPGCRRLHRTDGLGHRGILYDQDTAAQVTRFLLAPVPGTAAAPSGPDTRDPLRETACSPRTRGNPAPRTGSPAARTAQHLPSALPAAGRCGNRSQPEGPEPLPRPARKRPGVPRLAGPPAPGGQTPRPRPGRLAAAVALPPVRGRRAPQAGRFKPLR